MYRPVTGLMQNVQFAVEPIANESTVSAPLKPPKLKWLNRLKKSARNSTLNLSRDGIGLKTRPTDISTRYSPSVLPALRATFPLTFWKSTTSPLKMSAAPLPLAAAGARNVFGVVGQFAAPCAARQAAIPAELTRKFVAKAPAIPAVLIVPSGSTSGRW